MAHAHDLAVLGLCGNLEALGQGRAANRQRMVTRCPFVATRYHSLAIRRATLPKCLEVTAESEDGEIMGVRHRELAVEGVQFHPESFLTEHGHALLKNFLQREAA